jgi:hypothetical protein
MGLHPPAQGGDVTFSFWLQQVIPQGTYQPLGRLHAAAAAGKGRVALELNSSSGGHGGGVLVGLELFADRALAGGTTLS